MSKNTTTVKLEQDLERLEAAFLERLRESLHRCANGTWGLFGQNDHLAVLPRVKGSHGSSDAEALMDIVAEIDRVRKKLGLGGRPRVCTRFFDYRNLRGSNVPGEPKLAQSLLDELGT